jgi:peptidoglycan hydrolase-like protein with peptidoglycan-binding domain
MPIGLEQVIGYIPTLLRYASVVKEVLDLSRNNGDIAALLKSRAGPIFSVLTDLGAHLFPQAAKEIQVVGGAIAAYDPNITKWVQGACNEILQLDPKIDVDGIYGPKTKDAVIKLQEKLGLKVDGLAGRITQAAIDGWFSKQSSTK